MNRLRTRLILVFLLATLPPLGLTLWTGLSLLGYKLTPLLDQLDGLSSALVSTGRELSQQARDALQRDAAEGRATPQHLTPEQAAAFWETNQPFEFDFSGDGGDQLDYYVRGTGEVLKYSRPMGVKMNQMRQLIANSGRIQDSDLGKGFRRTLMAVTAVVWLAAMGVLVFIAARISRPVRRLTEGLGSVAAGDLSVRVPAGGGDEIGAAVEAFNHMAGQLQQARERLIHLTRLATWQALARKMAHEVKNSLTPIRLTMEEIVSRRGAVDDAFLEQASQIVADEVNTLERRVRAFSEFASEPPVAPAEIDVNAMLAERVSLLKSAHPEVAYQLRLAPDGPRAIADADLIKGVLTNLLENAAEAAQPGGVVMASTAIAGEILSIEVHDSGPGLSAQARSTLFEPSISLKKGHMGLGLSIARRSALLCGGDLQLLEGELGGAAFRLSLTRAEGKGADGSRGDGAYQEAEA